MSRIKLLDQSVYMRIAAGEVVQNPAAVVKELVENSIDAQATAITVEIEQGGKKLIRVTDNGHGIAAEDLPLAATQHATSKIECAADLSRISSLGFRGEALASIAAAARLTIRSREQGSLEGAVLTCASGAAPSVKPAGTPEGTTVLVEDLFFSIPARLKFLKATGAETAAVTSVVSELMLSHPEISIRYISGGKDIYHTNGRGDLLQVITILYGKSVADTLLSIGAEGGIVQGYISKAPAFYKSSRYMHLFLNGRYIRSKSIQSAILRGYGERLLKSHFPFAALYISLPFEQADINVHPHKLQAMFTNEQAVTQAVQSAVEAALVETGTPAMHIPEPKEEYSKDDISGSLPHASSKQTAVYKNDFSRQKPASRNLNKVAQNPDALLGEEMVQAALSGFETVMDRIVDEAENAAPPVQTAFEDVRNMVDYKMIGQAFDAYLLVECGDTLYLIDQHAAHERINYERMKAQAEKGRAQAQQMLVPHVAKLTHSDFMLLMDNRDALMELGFSFEEFGALALRFDAFPALPSQGSATALIDEVLYELRNAGGDIVLKRDGVIRAACRYSIKAGDKLSENEIASLLGEITKLGTIPNCPHGRPIAVALGKNELEKSFKRKV